ncbi:MAG: hypothetical protein QXS76_00145 [Candidatus Bathyarchaeia archaeon]
MGEKMKAYAIIEIEDPGGGYKPRVIGPIFYIELTKWEASKKPYLMMDETLYLEHNIHLSEKERLLASDSDFRPISGLTFECRCNLTQEKTEMPCYPRTYFLKYDEKVAEETLEKIAKWTGEVIERMKQKIQASLNRKAYKRRIVVGDRVGEEVEATVPAVSARVKGLQL